MFKKKYKELTKKIKVLLRQITPIKKEVNYDHKWYGSAYGGFYVHPNVLTSKSIVYSFGIGEDISFDNAIIEKHKCQVFGFDPTPKSINWIRMQQLLTGFSFFEYGIDTKTGFVNFNLPKNSNYVSGSVISHANVDENNVISVPMKKFSDILCELGHTHIDILKMDIEGAEFDVLDSILSSPAKIDQILIELHGRFFPDGKSKTDNLLKSFKDHGYEVFAVSDSFEEVSLIKVRNPTQ